MESLRREQLLLGLKKVDPEERKKAIALLVKRREARAIPLLRKMAASDPDAEVRFVAGKALRALVSMFEFEKLLGKGRKPQGGRKGRERSAAAPPAAPASGETAEGARAAEEELPIEKIAGLLSSADPSIRRKALLYSTAHGRKDALPLIQKLVKDERDVSVLSTALHAIGVLGGKSQIPVVSRLLQHENEEVRKAALSALASIGTGEIYPFLFQALNDESREVRRLSFTHLRKLGKKGIFSVLRKMFAAPQKWMRLCAARACGRFKADEAVELLIGVVNDEEDEEIVRTAHASLKRLAAAGLESAAEAVENLPPSPHESARKQDDSGASELEHSMIDVSLLTPEARLSDPDYRKRLEAVSELVEKGGQEALEALLEAYPREENEYVQATMLMAAARLGAGEERVRRIVESALASKRDRVRATAVEAICMFDDVDLVATLSPLLDDPDNRTRANAVVALKEYADEMDLTSPLEELAASNRIRDRLSAIYACAILATPDARKLLERLESDKSAVVARRAAEALRMLEAREKASHDLGFGGPSGDSAVVRRRRRGRKTAGGSGADEGPGAPGDGTAQLRTSGRKEKAAGAAGSSPAPASSPRRRPGEGTSTGSEELPQCLKWFVLFDVLVALSLGMAGMTSMLEEGPPEEFLFSFIVLFILVPALFLASAVAILKRNALGVHLNAAITAVGALAGGKAAEPYRRLHDEAAEEWFGGTPDLEGRKHLYAAAGAALVATIIWLIL